ncbi:MAG: hypothetical protein ABI411_08550 [Tahibacter sp.]
MPHQRSRRTFRWLGITATLLCTASFGADLPLKTYASASGHFSLRVDPQDRDGAGTGLFTLSRDGNIVWSGSKPFTFWEAVVADNGVIGGYAYSEGYASGGGEFIVAIIDANGVVQHEDHAAREWGHFLHSVGNPQSNGLFIDPDNDRFVVRVAESDINTQSEIWWTYRLHDAQLLGKEAPRSKVADATGLHEVIAARPVAGTPLTLVQWYRSIDGSSALSSSDHVGTRFALLDLDYRPVWSIDLADDYAVPGDEKAQFLRVDDIRQHGAILDTAKSSHFTLREVASNQRVEYRVDHGEPPSSAWQVRETARRPFDPVQASASTTASIKERVLKRLGSFVLEGAGSIAKESPIHDLFDFGMDDQGRFGFVAGCGCDGQAAEITLVDHSGELVRRTPIPRSIDSSHAESKLIWLRDDTWLLVQSRYAEPSKILAYRFNATDGSLRSMDGFHPPHIEKLVSTRDGGFAVLGSIDTTFTHEDVLVAFDANGKQRWQIAEDISDREKLFSPVEFTVTTSGEVVVLENIRKILQIYNSDGSFQKTIDLVSAWERQPNYPSGIEADKTGGVIVVDFQGHPPIVRMSLSGQVVSEFDPHFSDGRQFSMSGNVQSGTDGKLWTSDGAALLRLDERGQVDLVLGQRPDATALGNIAGISVTAQGRIYAIDERTGAVHVFDDSGKRIHVGQPDATDYKGSVSLPSLTIDDTGDIFVSRRDDNSHDFLHYSTDGRRIGIESSGIDDVAERWIAQIGSSNRWVLGYERIRLVSARGDVMRVIERRADGQWLGTPRRAVARADGGLAVVSQPTGDTYAIDDPRRPATVTIYSKTGDALKSWQAPEDYQPMSHDFANDGDRYAFLLSTRDIVPAMSLVLTDAEGKAQFRMALPSAYVNSSIFLLPRESGEELWLFDGKGTVERYAMP